MSLFFSGSCVCGYADWQGRMCGGICMGCNCIEIVCLLLICRNTCYKLKALSALCKAVCRYQTKLPS